MRKNVKLALKLYSPFKILEKVWHIAYKLEHPGTSRISPTFHVSQLKEHLGTTTIIPHLPSVLKDETLSPP